MAYARANRISASDYNLFIGGQSSRDPFPSEAAAAGKLAGIWGVGYGRYGYLQNESYPLDPVQPYARVEAVHWQNLQKALESCLMHQGQPLTNVPPATYFDTGDRVLVHDGSSAPGIWSAAIAQADANKDSSARDDVTLYTYVGPLPMYRPDDPNTPIYADIRNKPWGGAASSSNPALSFEVKVEFESGDHARAFFNAGCEMIIRYSYPTAASDEELEWKGVFESVFGDFAYGRDYIDFRGSHVPGATTNPPGYWNATGTNSSIYNESPLPGLSNPGNSWMWVWHHRISAANVAGNGDNGNVFTFGWAFFARSDAPNYVDGVRAEVFANAPRYLPDTILPVQITVVNPLDPEE